MQIIDYVKAIESHYTDQITKCKTKMQRVIKEEKNKRGYHAIQVDKKSELEEIFMDALEKTRLQIFKRKMRLERQTKKTTLTKKVAEIANLDETQLTESILLDQAKQDQIEPTI